MSSMLEQLWPVFLAEVSEKLDTVESMIIDADDGNADIDSLFREFHTLKSSFSMVDFRTPMELAHACEDVLHGLRKSSTTPQDNIRKYLLEAVDWIKQQLATATPGHYPQLENESLLAQLAPYRTMEEELTENINKNSEASNQDESATNNLTEEKEALAIDTLRINSSSLDNLVTNVSQLVQKETALSSTIADTSLQASIKNARGILQNSQLDNSENYNFSTFEAIENLIRTFSNFRQELLQADTGVQTAINEIQQDVMELRIIPLSTIFNRLPRIVRQKASAAGKQVQLIIEGGDVSIDKGMIEIISEPLIHLLHNAVIHGIETTEERKTNHKSDSSHIYIVASEEGSILRIEVRDDGRGIDFRNIREKAIRKGFAADNENQEDPKYWLNFMFVHGLNSENPNRTTGLDIVKQQLSRIGGSIDIDSTPGIGTQFQLRMPVTVAIQSAILINAAAQTFAIPARNVVEIIDMQRDALQTINGQPTINLRENMLPIYELAALFRLKSDATTDTISQITLMVIQNDNQCIALAIDEVIGRRDLFLRDIHPDLRNIPGVGGVSLLGNGNAVIILDCENLFGIARGNPQNTGSLLC